MKIFGLEIKWPNRGEKAKEDNQSFNVLGRSYVDPMGGLPVNGGRKNEVFGTVMPTEDEAGFGLISRPLSRAEYNRLYELARTNHDISYAVSNIVELANTAVNIEFDSSVSDKKAEEMTMAIKSAEKYWFEGGRPMLINALLRQLAITGALSAEAKPNRNLKGVGRISMLSPKWVYFGYDAKTDTFTPYQEVSNIAYGVSIQNSQSGFPYAPLSQKTYRYISIARDEDNPYAIPPILSAVEATCIESELLENLNAVVRRMGMLGFTKFSVMKPERQIDANGYAESDDAYRDRVAKFLAEVESELEKSMANGYVVAAKELTSGGAEISHLDAEMNASSNDSSGAAAIIELVQQIKAAGLKQDPVFLGKNFSTSEALAKVLLKKFGGQLADYQEAVAQFLEHAYSVHLQLLGYNFDRIDVSFEPPILEDSKTMYEALQLKLNYNKDLRNQGIINQQQFANAMGYDAPATDGPMVDASTIEDLTQEDTAANKAVEKPKEQGLSQFAKMELNKKSDDKYLAQLRKYNKATMSNLDAAAKGIVTDLVNTLNGFEGSKEAKLSIAKLSLLTGWQRHFERQQVLTVGKWTEQAYLAFRKDKAVFGGKPSSAPKVETADYVFADHFRDTDLVAMSNLMAKRLNDMPLQVAVDMPKGDLRVSDLAALKLAIQRMGTDLMNITTSTAANLRVLGGLMYLRQEGVEAYTIGNGGVISCSSCVDVEGNVLDAYKVMQGYVINGNRNPIMPPVPMLLGQDWDASTAVFETCRCKIRAKY